MGYYDLRLDSEKSMKNKLNYKKYLKSKNCKIKINFL